MTRTKEQILYDFDNPCIAEWPESPLVSRTSTVREMVQLETSLDIREYLKDIKDVLDDCLDSLNDIKENIQ